ncbi:hypothetical protein [Sulfolobus acidocaldarius]|uniref:hypothetical protein n=1 Tax=Sulfolobus acidocaldarius TaxID=2285 RepID=UPI000AFE4E3C|nr:hypothetical protein [Sulfolobus acidocaldarius]WCM35776.1 hypothetical protein GO597_10765 [Sulfolobus acidocaldarius DSM 639]
MNSHFPWNSTGSTIMRWVKIFFYNTIWSKYICISENEIEFYEVDKIVVHI